MGWGPGAGGAEDRAQTHSQPATFPLPALLPGCHCNEPQSLRGRTTRGRVVGTRLPEMHTASPGGTRRPGLFQAPPRGCEPLGGRQGCVRLRHGPRPRWAGLCEGFVGARPPATPTRPRPRGAAALARAPGTAPSPDRDREQPRGVEAG